MKTISILGSTGSIGTQTLSVISEMSDIKVSAMAARGSNIDLFEEQVRKFMPKLACVYDKDGADILAERLKALNITVVSGMDGLIECATEDETDIVLTAVVGMIGIKPTIAAIKAGKDIALANKETLVAAGHIITRLARKKGVSILPVDSEHSAIFQCLKGNEDQEIRRILLTASGGPFRGRSIESLEKVTVKQALAHPNWSMGNKVTIDSATMVNKGLEVIEAKWLFDVPLNRIQVVVHPQSIVHSAVEFEDGSILAQMGNADMRIPIHYALTYPSRGELSGEPLDLFEVGNLSFEHPDMETFFGLALAFDAALAGGNMPCVYNAANEVAVASFLKGETSFLSIPEAIAAALQEIDFMENPTVDQILDTEELTRKFTLEYLAEVN
ncbi:MAG: 1-deoxy-D-xylulose-5-phosphate reductoisomerase [Lachnospiraceae bacterium]|nr:1-deoxy-D-xylulose-5-phosphate reductoisomerase [Lachnospiraceae bacterium]